MQNLISNCGKLLRLAVSLLNVSAETLRGLQVDEVHHLENIKDLPVGAAADAAPNDDGVLWEKRLHDFHRQAVTNRDRAMWLGLQSTLKEVEVPGKLTVHVCTERVYPDEPVEMPVGFLDEETLVQYLKHLHAGDEVYGDCEMTAIAYDKIVELFGDTKPLDYIDKHKEVLDQAELQERLMGQTEYFRTLRPIDGGSGWDDDPASTPVSKESWKTFPHPWLVPVGEKVPVGEHPSLVEGRLPKIYIGPVEAEDFKELRQLYPAGIPVRNRYCLQVSVGKFHQAIGELQKQYPVDVVSSFVDLYRSTLSVYKYVECGKSGFWFMCREPRPKIGMLYPSTTAVIRQAASAGYPHAFALNLGEGKNGSYILALIFSKSPDGVIEHRQGENARRWEDLSVEEWSAIEWVPKRKMDRFGAWNFHVAEEYGLVRCRCSTRPSTDPNWCRTSTVWKKLPRLVVLDLEINTTKDGRLIHNLYLR